MLARTWPVLCVQVCPEGPVVMILHLGRHCCGNCRCLSRHSVHNSCSNSSSCGKIMHRVVQLPQAGMCIPRNLPHHSLIQPL